MLDSNPRFCHTSFPMASQTRSFVFRNRRWFLLALAAVVLLGFAHSANSGADSLPLLLKVYFPGFGIAFWNHACLGLAAALIGIGAFWRTWGSAYLGTNVVQDRKMHTDRLVGDGPYRLTRNPLYLGNMFMVLGLGILLNLSAFLVLVVGMWILVRLFIRDEEAGFEESGGESYRAYRAAVPRLLPALRPRISPAGERPRWLQGFCGESLLWTLTVMTTGFAVTLNHAWFGRYLLWAFVITLPLFIWARRHTKKQAATERA